MKHPVYNIYLRAVFFFLVLAAAAPGVCETVVLNPDSPSTDLVIVSESSTEIIMEFQLGSLEVDSVLNAGEQWTRVRIPGGGASSNPGQPELPAYSKWIRIPWSNPRVDVLESERRRFTWGRPLPAPQVMLRANNDTLRRVADRRVYERGRYFPANLVSADVNGKIGGANVALITVTPVQVNPRSGDWRIYPSIRIRVSGARRGKIDEAARLSVTSQKLLSTLTRSPESPALDEVDENPRLLIVTLPQFVGPLQPFVEWKSLSGVPVETIIFTDVAGNAPELRQHLITLVESYSPQPEFLLIVGDIDDIPAFFGVSNSLTDHPYSTLQGDDYLPDISVGRLPVNSPAELAQWVTRLLNYERDALLPEVFRGTSFSSSVALDPQHGQQISALFTSAGLTVSQLQQPQTGTLPMLLNSLNQNPLWVFYIGHGYAQAWSSVSPQYQSIDVSEVVNSSSSIIVSVACATADIDYPGTSISEEWFSQSLNGGLLAYFGATESTAFFYSDTLGIATLQGVFTEEFERLGTAADYGRLMCAEYFPQLPGGLTEETIQQFVLLGDPSMRVYSQPPQTLTVTHAASIPVGGGTLPVSVLLNGTPLAGAEICLSGTQTYVRARTSTSGSAALPVTQEEPAELTLTVTARNAIPYSAEIQLVPNNAPYVLVSEIAVSDSAGDGDGRADRGESCALQLTLTNIGALSSAAGTLSIAASPSSIELGSASLAVPEIPAGGTSVLTEMIPFTVANDAQDAAAVTLTMTINTDGGDPTTSLETLVLHAPNIIYRSSELMELTGDGDGNPEGGELLALDLFFTNGGSERALPLDIDLNSSPSFLQIHDTRVSTDTLTEGEDFAVRFLFDANENTPRGYPFEFYYELEGANVGYETGWDAVRVGQVPVLLYEIDQAPDQIDAIEAALTSLGIEYERLTSLPMNLFRYRSVWIFCGVSPNARPLPQQEALRLSEYLDGGGNAYWEGADVWSYDLQYALHPYFHIEGINDGSSNAGPVVGEYGTEYQNYSFEYEGENSFIDQLEPIGGASVMLRNDRSNHTYPVCIAYASPVYRTIGSSIEIGSLSDGTYPSTRVHFIAAMLDWFGIETRVDIYPPVIQHIPRQSFHRQNVPIPVVADIQDASGIASVLLNYRIDQAAPEVAVMNLVNGLYRSAIPGVPWGAAISYSIQAADQAEPPNQAATDEYSFTVTMDPYEPLDLSFENQAYRIIKPRIDAPENSCWSMTKNEEQRPVIELHGASASTPISYTTGVFDCSHLENTRLLFWNYLRSGPEDHGIVARVLGSRDGGRTFPFVVWHRVQEGASILEEGTIDSDIMNWMDGQSRVALRFETTTGWYWRFGEMRIIGDALPDLRPVQNLTVRPGQGGMQLNWESVEGALRYRVYTSPVANTDQFAFYRNVADTTYIDHESRFLKSRFYRVDALMRKGREYVPRSSVPEASPAHLGAADIRWSVRKNNLNRP